MRIIKTTTKPNGTRRMIIEVPADEHITSYNPDHEVVIIDPDAYYTLGEPMQQDVFAGHILAGATPAYWCSLEQKWLTK